jgi:ABC-type multidrug transport system fused ATPase/permease subunit
LSAVDAHTARHIVNSCLKGPLTTSRTLIMVTHATDLCVPVADEIVVMRSGGTIAASGPVSNVLNSGENDPSSRVALEHAGLAYFLSGGGRITQPESQLKSPISIVVNNTETGPGKVKGKSKDEIVKDELDKGIKRVTKDESTGSGHVSWSVYKFYLNASGGILQGSLLIGSIVMAYALSFMHDFALKEWSNSSTFSNSTESDAENNNRNVSSVDTTYISSSTSKYLIMYALAAFLALSSLYLRYAVQIIFALRASRSIHGNAIQKLLRAPMSFFDSTPSGRVVNRFGKDMQVVDQEVVGNIGETVQQITNGIVVVCMIGTASPLLILGAIPISMLFRQYFFYAKFAFQAFLYIPIARRFLAITRSVTRLEKVSRSPVYSAFNEALA